MQILFRSARNYIRDHQDMVSFYGFSMLYGMLGALIIILFFNFFHNQEVRIGTVNVTGLVNRFIKQESNKNISDDQLKKEVKHYGITLNKELELLSKQKRVVLLLSEAVIAGGSEDYTAYINQRLSDKEDAQNE